MKKHTAFSYLAAAAILAFALPQPAVASPAPNAQEMKKIEYLIGTWKCDWTAGPAAGTKSARFTPVLNGAWLQEEEIEKSASGSDVVVTMHFTGYDTTAKRWMHLGPNADGTPDVAQSDDIHIWHNIIPAGGEDATLEKVSDTSWSLTEPFSQNGQHFVYSQKCNKVVP